MADTEAYKRPLRLVENAFLQVLATDLTLTHLDPGTDLEVKFSENSDTISSGKGKTLVKEGIPNFETRSAHLQAQLDSVLIDRTRNHYTHAEPDFPFRYASGGTLPIVRMRDKIGENAKDYYCFFYRDAFPVGWNIANGGCCTRDELLNPVQTIERELQEELILVDRHKKIHYVFKLGKAQTSRPHGLHAHRDWLDILPDLAKGAYKRVQVVSKWIDGPDIARVQIDNDEFSEVLGCFVNVNAEDFGIEFDKIMRIAIRKNVVILDGEQTRTFVLNRVVGLFDVDSLTKAVVANSTGPFLPDIFFHGADDSRDHPEFELEAKIEEMVSRFRRVGFRSEKGWEYFKNCREKRLHLDLCPVTRRIVKRCAMLKPFSTEERSANVFISYGGDDDKIAREVSNVLQPVNTFYFWNHPFHDVLPASIDRALEEAKCLVLVGSSLSNINREHCKYEWKRFWQDVQDGFKEGCPIVLYIDHRIDERELPAELLDWPRVRFWSWNSSESLGKLKGILPRDLSDDAK